MLPQVRFENSIEKDVDTFFSFVSDAAYDGGRSLEWAVFSVFPELKKLFEDKKFVGTRDDIASVVRAEHEKNEVVIAEKTALYEKEWKVMSDKFFILIKEIFGKRPWSEGKYIAYPTMWGMYPRFLEDKTMQVPYDGKICAKVNEIVAHELLHFMFYDYFFEKYPQCAGEDCEMFAWHVTEIFNTVVQNSQKWRTAFHHDVEGYPEHEGIVATLQKDFPHITEENLAAFTEAIVTHVQDADIPKDC